MKAFRAERPPHPQPVALLIPGVAIAYSKAIEQLRDNSIFRANCARATIDDFREADPEFLMNYDYFRRDNLDNQKLSYVVNCTMWDLYEKRGIVPQSVVGYSMGLYSALYAARFYPFETGVSIVEKAFHLIKDLCSSRGEKYGMGLILGLTEKEIRKLLFKRVREGVEIAVYNGKRSLVISGKKEEVDFCLDKAVKQGALGVRPLLTDHPYHTAFLKDISHDFSRFLNTLQYSEPVSNVLSLVDGKIISRDSVVDAIVRMIYSSLYLDTVIDALVRVHDVSVCYETGPPGSMRKLVKYIYRGLKVHSFEEEGVL